MKQSQIATNQFLEEYTKIENEIINKDKIINYKMKFSFKILVSSTIIQTFYLRT